MAVYIKGMGNISPQQTWGDHPLITANAYPGNRLRCIEPDYSAWFDPKQSRRMSRIIKMGVASATMALREAGIDKPDAIITGTGYGCMEDTGNFLEKMIENEEVALNPTPFMQSTHNTIGSQIALLLQCEGYNQTYSHGGLSFENALLDSMLLLNESGVKTLLLGAVDEITDTSHEIQQRFGIFRNALSDNLKLFDTADKGTVHGEGAAFFVLSADHNNDAIASLCGMTTFYNPSEKELETGIHDFLSTFEMKAGDVDLLLSGMSGDHAGEKKDVNVEGIFSGSTLARFKHLCGEYPVASSFALWLATKVLQQKHVPDFIIFRDTTRKVTNILIYNEFFGSHHSLILLKAT